MAKTAAIVLNWRRPDDTCRCVQSLLDLDRDIDIVVVDNDSRDGSIERIGQYLASAVRNTDRYRLADEAQLETGDTSYSATPNRLFLIQSENNGGYAAGNNIGIRHALSDPTCEFIWILNNDTIVCGPDAIDDLERRMAEDPTIGVCGSTVVYDGFPPIVQSRAGGDFDPATGRCKQICCGDPLTTTFNRDDIERRLAYINGAASFVRREFVETVGLMSEDYFLYFEEIDWISRARGRFRLGYAPRSVISHRVGASSGTSDFGGSSPTSKFYMTRSRLRYLWRYSRRSIVASFLDILRTAIRELRRGCIKDCLAICLGATQMRHVPSWI